MPSWPQFCQQTSSTILWLKKVMHCHVLAVVMTKVVVVTKTMMTPFFVMTKAVVVLQAVVDRNKAVLQQESLGVCVLSVLPKKIEIGFVII